MSAYPYKVDLETTEQEYIDNVFTLEIGDVFQFDHKVMQFEDTIVKLEKFQPANVTTFEVQYLSAGTQLYTVYNHSTIVITKVVRV